MRRVWDVALLCDWCRQRPVGDEEVKGSLTGGRKALVYFISRNVIPAR